MRTPFVFSFGRHLEPCLILGSVLGLCGRGAWITACAVFFHHFTSYSVYCGTFLTVTLDSARDLPPWFLYRFLTVCLLCFLIFF